MNKIELLKMMLRIRLAEEKIVEVYPEQKMRTPVHLSIGEEAVSAGVCSLLKKEDLIFCSHRCHAGFLAKGGGLLEFFSEIYGKETGSNKGRGGSAHLGSNDIGVYAGSILAGMSPVAVGAAFSFMSQDNDNIAVSFLGDAATEEGVFAESLNFAIVKNIPVIFVCENNLFSTHTHIKYRQPDIPIYKRVEGLGIKSVQVDGNNVLDVVEAAKAAVEYTRKRKGPYFIESLTYRWFQHVGPDQDFDNPYRTKEEVQGWMDKCPIKRLKQSLIEENILNEKEINRIEENIKEEVNQAHNEAVSAPWPENKDLLKNVY